MFYLPGLVLIPLGYLYLWPLTQRWLGRSTSPLLTGLTAVSLSIGALSVSLFWLGILPGAALTAWTTLIVVAVGLGIGFATNRDWWAPGAWRAYWLAQWKRRLGRLNLDGLLLWAIIGSLSVILIHTLYYPFIGDDALSRYGMQAQWIYTQHRLPNTVWGYPPLAPLVYAATWFAVGTANEPLAKLLSVVAGAGMLGGIYLMGRHIWDEQRALIAAALAALTPLFIRNATLPYTDIPTGFPLILSSLFAMYWWKTGALRDALAAGVLLGVALFTKQSAFTWLTGAVAVPVIWVIATRSQAMEYRWRRMLTGLAGMVLPSIFIAIPWYVRNVLLGGWINVVPIAGEYHLLGPMTGWLGLVPSLAWPGDFGPALAWVYAGGWLIGLALAARQAWSVLRAAQDSIPYDLLIAVMAVPYWLAWWMRFSFEARFLVLIIPFMALWAARPLGWLSDWLTGHVHIPKILGQFGGAILLTGLLLWGAQDRLGGVYRAVTQPFASEEDRIQRVRRDVFALAEYIRNNIDPDDSRIMVMDGALAYYLRDYDVTVSYPLRIADLEGYDYLVHSSSIYAVYSDRLGWDTSEFYAHVWDESIFEPVYESGGVHIMRILRTDLPSPAEYEAVSSPAAPAEEP